MRLAIAATLCIVLLGGVALYMQARETFEAPPQVLLQDAPGRYSVCVMTTFRPSPDPFALRGHDASFSGLTVKLHGKHVLGPTSQPDPENMVFRAEVPQLLAGINEFYVEAYPDLDAASRPNALRVEITRDGLVLSDRTFWAEPGERVAGTLTVRVP